MRISCLLTFVFTLGMISFSSCSLESSPPERECVVSEADDVRCTNDQDACRAVGETTYIACIAACNDVESCTNDCVDDQNSANLSCDVLYNYCVCPPQTSLPESEPS